MDNLFEFVIGACPFALAFGVAGMAVGIWEHIEIKKAQEQAKNKRRTKIRHAEDMDKLQQTKQMKFLYYDTLLY